MRCRRRCSPSTIAGAPHRAWRPRSRRPRHLRYLPTLRCRAPRSCRRVMLFSSPDYPVFLFAVFFLYALARWGGPQLAWARIAVMVLLGDVVFLLVAKDPDALWDPIGGGLLRLAIGELRWSPVMAWHWAIGAAVLGGALAIGRRCGGWIASDRGQAQIARGIVCVLVAIGATVAIAWQAGTLDDVTAA